MRRRMKLSVTIIIALFIAAGARFSGAEEKPFPLLAALSSTTISGYVHTGTHWQLHVCRPMRPIRAQPVVVDPPDGPPRVVGHGVRCRHAVMFIPSVGESRVRPTPNRSSAFGVAMRRAPRRPGRPSVQPPPPPPIPTNRPPVIVITNIVMPPIIVRPPSTGTNIVPPVIVRQPGSISGAISERPRFRPPSGPWIRDRSLPPTPLAPAQ